MRAKKPSGKPSLQAIQNAMNIYRNPDADPARLPSFMNEKPRKVGTRNKHEEHDAQADCVAYLHTCCPSVFVSASMNGELGKRMNNGKFFGWMNKLKKRGMISGWPDLVLHWAMKNTVYIEMKKPGGGAVSEAQKYVHTRLNSMGFRVYIVHTLDELKEIIKLENIPCLEAL